MERFTERDDGRNVVYAYVARIEPEYGADCMGIRYVGSMVDRLAAYENSGLEPEEIAALLDSTEYREEAI